MWLNIDRFPLFPSRIPFVICTPQSIIPHWITSSVQLYSRFNHIPISIAIKWFVPYYLIWFDLIPSDSIWSHPPIWSHLIPSGPIPSDHLRSVLIWSDPIRSDPIQSNPIQSNRFVLLWMIETPYPALSIVYWVSSYLQRIMTTKSFTITFRLLVVVLIDDCWLLYVYLYISTICWYYSCSFFVVYVHNIVRCLVLQLLI